MNKIENSKLISEFEISSGYAGYRNEVTGDWIYEKDYLEIFAKKDKTAEKENYRRVFTQENGWQDEIVYTKEEVINLLKAYKLITGSNEDARCFFEKFKK